ncbi:MAG: ATP-binding cassette domain-containing protein [Ilumatobacter sp.]
MSLVTCRSLMKVYRVGDSEVLALQGLDLDVSAGEMLGVVGASGSGKSTLLSVLGGLVRPDAGSASVGDLDLMACSERDRERYRLQQVGFVWQSSYQILLTDPAATENVERPLLLAGRNRRRVRAQDLLEQVGLGQRVDHRPALLSGGEQARVAIAVALAMEPMLVLADEPTGELDGATTDEIFGVMRDLSSEHGVTQIIVSHDPDLIGYVDRVVGIRDGRTSVEMRRGDGDDVASMLVVDDVGRIQLPAEAVEQLGIGGRVEVEILDGELRVRPAPIGDGGVS